MEGLISLLLSDLGYMISLEPLLYAFCAAVLYGCCRLLSYLMGGASFGK